MVDDIMKEMAWERRMMGLGQCEFDRKERTTNNFTNTKAGQMLLSTLLYTYADKIAEVQKRLIHEGRNRTNVGPLLFLEPEAYALIALRNILDSVISVGDAASRGFPLQLLSKRIASAIEIEVNFRHWVTESRKRAKAWAEEVGLRGTVQSSAERLIKREGVTRSTLSRWRRCFTELTEYEWSDETKVHVGETLIMTLLECFPDYFELRLLQEKGKTQKRFRKTEVFEEEIRRVHTNYRVGATLLMPMISPPIPWATY